MDLCFQTAVHTQVLLFSDAECMYLLWLCWEEWQKTALCRCVNGKTFTLWFTQGVYLHTPMPGAACLGKRVSQLPVLSPWMCAPPVFVAPSPA